MEFTPALSKCNREQNLTVSSAWRLPYISFTNCFCSSVCFCGERKAGCLGFRGGVGTTPVQDLVAGSRKSTQLVKKHEPVDSDVGITPAQAKSPIELCGK